MPKTTQDGKEHLKIALFLAEVESVAISLPAEATPSLVTSHELHQMLKEAVKPSAHKLFQETRWGTRPTGL